MHVVIKGTKTIAEYTTKKIEIETLATKAYETHKQATENKGKWVNGEPVKAWYNADRNICVEYENGQYWTYLFDHNGCTWQ